MKGDRFPVGFVSHGAPTLAFDPEKGRDLRAWAESMPRPGAILVVSAHWEHTPLSIGTVNPRGLMYDFSGFDRGLYELRYDAPGAPQLASRVAALLEHGDSIGVAHPMQQLDRMWDHGVWVPLLHMYPEADVPVLQVSLPSRAGVRPLYEIGRQLRALRDERVMILASGGMVHNLGQIDWHERSGTQEWATSFESWTRQALSTWAVDDLLAFESKAPDWRRAHPTLEHFLPLIVALGAATPGDRVSFPIEGFEFGNLSRTSVQFG